MVLQAFSNFFARSMHGQRGDIGAQADRQVPALAGFKRASPLFEPPFELGAGHVFKDTTDMLPIQRRPGCLPGDREEIPNEANFAQASYHQLPGSLRAAFGAQRKFI
jgi:hypothetical protein